MNVTRLRIDFKTALLILTAAWTPAIAIGGGLLKWGFAMDHRVTVQEQVNIKLVESLARIESVQTTEVQALRTKVDALQIQVAAFEARK